MKVSIPAELALGDLLKAYRSEAQLSQEELAERAGVSTRTVSDIECGVAKAPRAITLSLLAEALTLGPEDRARLRASIRRPAPGARAEPRNRLPPAQPLIGRDADVSAAVALLRTDTPRLLTFVGPPGVGKTSLALRVAAEVEPGFAGDAVLVELGALADAALVATKIALALGVRDVPGEPPVQTVLRRLNESPTLLLLDTVEHLLAAAPFIEELLAGAPQLVIVATSRVALRIASEREFAVGPLPIPAASPTAALADLAAVPTVALLLERARASKRDFALTAENAAAVAELCRSLDGIPLAIELIAPRLKLFSPASLSARVGQRLPLLEADRFDRPARHRTMRAALAWSFALLTPAEQAVLRRIALFRGRFSVDGACAIARAADEDLPVLSVLAVLVDHNLVRVAEYDGEPYFELPQLIREYAYEQLVAGDERDMVHLRLTAYCLEIAPRVRLVQTPDERRPIMERLEREAANFNVLLAWMLESGRLELGLRFAFALWAFWYLRGSCAEGFAWSTAFIDAVEREPGDLPADLLADAYRQMTSLAVSTGDLVTADRAATRALALKRHSGDRKAIAFIANVAGVIASQRGEYPHARQLIEEGLRLRRELGDPHEIGNSLQALGHSLADSGDDERGSVYLEESLAFYARVAGALGAGESLQILGLIAARRNDTTRAEALSREALAIGERHGHTLLIASATVVLGKLAVRRGAHADAALHFGNALDIFESASFADIPEVLEGLAGLAQATRHSREAVRLLGGATALRGRMRKTIVPADRAAHEGFVATVSAALPARLFEAEWTIGQTLSFTQLRALARALIASP